MTTKTNSESRPEWEPVAWQWRRTEKQWSLDYTFNSQVYATAADSEVRALYSPAVHTEMLRAQESERVLRQIVSECAAALGTSSGCAPEASLEFMRLVPAEIQDTIAALREALAAPVVTDGDVAASSYDMIDWFLRNNLNDDAYAEFSAALDAVLFAAAPKPKEQT